MPVVDNIKQKIDQKKGQIFTLTSTKIQHEDSSAKDIQKYKKYSCDIAS